MSDPDLPALKTRLRQEGFARRDALEPDWRRRASEAIAGSALSLPELRGIEPVGGYWPIRSEVDPLPILAALSGQGRVVALPQTRLPLLVWRRWQPGEHLAQGAFGVMEPLDEALETEPHALLVPLCAFDRRGGRLGYGQGHFDRSIAALSSRRRPLTIGLAFSVQEVDAVPMDGHDRALDLIVTERGVIRIVQAKK